jgi:hypothetical protein
MQPGFETLSAGHAVEACTQRGAVSTSPLIIDFWVHWLSPVWIGCHMM